MARFTLKQKWISIGRDFVIRDGDGDVVYRVDGKVLALGDKLIVNDASGNEVGRIVQRLLAFRPVYAVKRGGERIAVVKKKLFTPFRDRFLIDVPGPDDLEAVGSFLDHEYEIKLGRKEVATVSKRWISLTDSYGIEVMDGVDPFLPLATAVIIDLICHEQRDGDNQGPA